MQAILDIPLGRAEFHRAPAPSARDAAFAREALPWLERVRGYARSLAGSAADADDLVQETYFRAYRGWHTYDPGSDCRSWLYAICRNVFRHDRRRQRDTIALAEPDAVRAPHPDEPLASSAPDDDRSIDRIDLAPAIAAALEQIPEPYRSAVIMVDMEDLTYGDVAARIGVPIGTVRSRLFRGRRLLRPLLAEHARERGYAAAG